MKTIYISQTLKALALSLLSLAFFADTAAAGSRIRVLQFNIRLTNSGDGNNNWYYRCRDVVDFCHDTEADVIGMQEVTPGQRTYVMNSLAEYTCLGLGREGGQSGEHNPIFFRKDKYVAENSGTFWLSDTPDVPASNTWGAACRRICTWALLRDKVTGERFLYANTHFDHQSSNAQTKSSPLVKSRLQQYAKGYPILLTGDFNVTPGSVPYNLMIEPDGTFPMEEAWRDARVKEGLEGTFHSWGTIAVNKRSRIDFIFVTKDVKTLRCVTDDDTKRPRMLSDHDPVYADFLLP